MRLGLHWMSPDADDAFRDYVDAVRPPMVKMLDPGPGENELAAWCQARGVETIGRLYIPQEEQSLGAEGGRQIRRVVAQAHACPNIKYWELHNEAWAVPGEMDGYASLSIEFMKAMEAIGRVAVIGCFSEGTPQVDGSDGHQAWREYLPAVKYAIDHGHVLALHEYSAYHMAALVPWHTLRYRQSLAILAGMGVQVDRLKIAITESGLDDIQDDHRQGPQGKGWRDYNGTEWAREPLSPHGDYAGQMAWYCGELGKDKQIVGVVDFGWSARERRSWESFDLSLDGAMLARMKFEMSRLPRGGSTSPGGGPVSDRLNEMLRAEFGALYDDLRGKLATNPNGPNGGFGALPPERVDTIVLHHTAGGRETTWEATALYHVQTRGFAGIGYHIGVRLGRVAYLGSVNTARAHVANENHHTIGVSVAGNYQIAQPAQEDLALLPRLCKVLDAYFGRTMPWRGHKDVSPPSYTVCPGQYLYPALATLRAGTPENADAQFALALGKWADEAQGQGIQPNPGGALFKAIDEDGFVVLTDESGARGAWPAFPTPGVVAQLARRYKGTEERIYFWRDGKVGWKRRGVA